MESQYTQIHLRLIEKEQAEFKPVVFTPKRVGSNIDYNSPAVRLITGIQKARSLMEKLIDRINEDEDRVIRLVLREYLQREPTDLDILNVRKYPTEEEPHGDTYQYAISFNGHKLGEISGYWGECKLSGIEFKTTFKPYSKSETVI